MVQEDELARTSFFESQTQKATLDETSLRSQVESSNGRLSLDLQEDFSSHAMSASSPTKADVVVQIEDQAKEASVIHVKKASTAVHAEENGDSSASKKALKSSIIFVKSGADEDEPPTWTLVNTSTPMNSSVNVITGTRITHGHPLMIG